MKEEKLYIVLFTVFTGVLVDPAYKLSQKISFLFLGKNFLEKLIFYLRISFQVRYAYTKNFSWTFFYLGFWPMYVYKSGAIFWPNFRL